ncbi:MAG: EamA family transporter [Alphaproteobacteria bacterium]
MIQSWVLLTFAAAFFQNLRTALQKRVADNIDVVGATYARYLFGFPLSILYAIVIWSLWDQPALTFNWAFLLGCLVGGAAQILATVLLVASFKLRNFAVATTYSKTEVIQTALFSLILLGEGVSPLALIGIVISLMGVIAMSMHGQSVSLRLLLTGWTQRAALYGILAGGLFGIAGVAFRGASLDIGGDASPAVRAAMVLAVTNLAQTLMMTGWYALRDRGGPMRVIRAWRTTVPVGVTGMLGSVFWFTAFAYMAVPYVRAVGQVELILSLLTSRLFFKERISGVEVLGMALTVAGIVVVLLAA